MVTIVIRASTEIAVIIAIRVTTVNTVNLLLGLQ
jgi:hypothetical protein